MSAAVVPILVSTGAPSDAELVRRALSRDRWAEETLYRRHVDRVTAVVAKLLRHGPDVEDVVQDAFIDALSQLANLREPERLGRWLVGIAVHKAHRRFRRRRLLRTLGLDRSTDDERLVSQIGPAAPADLQLEIMRIDEALDAMGVEDRTCWVLRHLEGHSLDEVAEIVGCSLATVKRRLARAQARVVTVLAEDLHD